MQALAHRAYGNVQQRTAGDDQIEIAIIKQITAELENVDGNKETGPADLADAVSRNLQMWTIFATDLADPGNSAPDQAKASLISIAGYVHRESRKILAGDGSITDLIDVNRNLLTSLTASTPSNEVAA